mgnify:CR=1 FL=1
MPALTLFVYVTVAACVNPPTPVVVAAHGAWAVPSNVNGPAPHVTVVVEGAAVIVNVAAPLLARVPAPASVAEIEPLTRVT